MVLLSFFYEPHYLRIALLVLGGVFTVLALLFHFIKRRTKLLPSETTLEDEETPLADQSPPDEIFESQPAGATQQPPCFEVEGSLLTGFFRTSLVLLAGVVAVGFILILMPQSTVEKLSQSLRLSQPPPNHQDIIAFLYLGDEIRGGEFHIRGVIRNITTQPIEKLDATVRLFSSEGRVIETAIVRLETEIITPDATASFHLRYSNYRGQFSSYSVQFKLRNGLPVPYKDMRGSPKP